MSDRVTVVMTNFGPATAHNLQCWMCEKRPAVYDMDLIVFMPCWECQRYVPSSLWAKKRPTWKRILGIGAGERCTP